MEGYGLGSGAVLGCFCPWFPHGDAGVGYGSGAGCCAPSPEPGRALAWCLLLPAFQGALAGTRHRGSNTGKSEPGGELHAGSPTCRSSPELCDGLWGMQDQGSGAKSCMWCLARSREEKLRGAQGALLWLLQAVATAGGHWVAGTPLLAVPHPHPMCPPRGKGWPVVSPPQPLAPAILPSPPLPQPHLTGPAVFTKTGEKSFPQTAGALIWGERFPHR